MNKKKFGEFKDIWVGNVYGDIIFYFNGNKRPGDIEYERDCENLYNSFKAIKEVIPIVKKELMKIMLEQMKINDEANLNAEKEIEKMKKDIKKIEKE